MPENGTALVARPVSMPSPTATLIRPVAQLADMLESERLYQEAVKQICDDSDYQEFTEGSGDNKKIRRFRKKSGWRKLQRFFGVSTEDVGMEERMIDCNAATCVNDCPGFHYEVVYRYRAIAPNGQYEGGEGSCIDIEDAPEPREVLRRRVQWRNAETYLPNRKSRHDVLSTAATRAYNRAVSNLIGAGEVSAEEMSRKKERHENDGGDDSAAQAAAADRAAQEEAKAERKRAKALVTEIYGMLGVDPKSKDKAAHAEAIASVAKTSGIEPPEAWSGFALPLLEKFIEYRKRLPDADSATPASEEAKPQGGDVVDAEFTENPPAQAQGRQIDDVATLAASADYTAIQSILSVEGIDEENAHLQELAAIASQADGDGVIYAWRRLKARGLKRLLELLEAEKDEIPL